MAIRKTLANINNKKDTGAHIVIISSSGRRYKIDENLNIFPMREKVLKLRRKNRVQLKKEDA